MKRLILAALVAAATTAPAAAPPDPIVEAWFKVNVLKVSVGVSGSPDKDTFTYELTPDVDLRIEIASKQGSGKLMLVSGVLLSKGVPIESGYEIDAIDGPALTMQLVNKLLAFAAGVAPSELRGRKTIDIQETEASIHVATSSAEGGYKAPWRLAGTLTVAQPSVVDFTLTHTSSGEGRRHSSVTYTGRWEVRSPAPVLPDSLSLEGWRVYELGPRQFSSGGGTVVDYGASASPSSYSTLGALRAAHGRKAK